MKAAIVVLLLVALAASGEVLQVEDVESSFTITWTCGSCPSYVYGYNCFLYNGGPFYNLYASIDSSYSSCSATGMTFPTYINFNCGVACSGCGISITMGYITQSTCATSSDGSSFIDSMNILYGASQGDLNKTYDWCGNAGCPLGSNVGLIIGLVIGALVVIVVIAIIIRQRRKRAAAQNQYLNAGGYQNIS